MAILKNNQSDDLTLKYLLEQNKGSGGDSHEIDDLKEDVEAIELKIGSTPLPTTAQTLTGAIAEHEGDISTLTSDVSGKVSKSGDAMTGNLAIANSGADLLTIKLNDFPLTAPGSDNYLRAINITDANDVEIGKIEVHYRANGRRGIQISADRNINGTDIYNGLGLSVRDNGDSSVIFDQKDAWLDALDLLSVTSTTTISSIATASSGFSITSAYYYQWGKVAQIVINVTRTGSSITTSGTHTVATMVSGKRPITTTSLLTNYPTSIPNSSMASNGVLSANVSSWAKDATRAFRGTFLLP